MRRALPIVLSILAGACSAPGIPVSQAEYGEKWPLTINAGTLRCDTDGPRKHVTLDNGNGIYYALNGSAKTFGYPDVKAVLKPGMVGTDLEPLITRGLTLCRNR